VGSNARVLIFDIETSPNIGYTWGKYDQTVIQFIQTSYTLCFSYRWLGDKTTHVVAQPDFPEYYAKNPNSDLKVVEALWALMDEADIVVAHNGVKFDIKKMNTRYAVHGMGPHSPVMAVDTLTAARKAFAFNSNKLDDLGYELNLGRKVKHEGFSLWTSCMAGDMAAWRRMKKYAKQDVVLLHDLYVEMLPWINNHPSMAMLSDRPHVCPKCGSDAGMVSRGFKTTKTLRYRQFKCQKCGSYSRGRIRDPGASVPLYV